MNGRRLILFSLMAVFGIAMACETQVTGPQGPTGELPRELTEAERKLIDADRVFSYELFRNTVAHDDEENLMISPLSVSMALAMTLNGARKQTFEEMRNTLHLQGLELEEINEAFESLTDLLVTADPLVRMKIANSIWHDALLPVEEDFLQRVQQHYRAGVSGLDFSDPGAVDIINNWVAENTEGLIEEIIDEIPDEIVMYLVNALYFKGDWLRPFDLEDTHSADFHLEDGESVEVEMMRQEGRFALYSSADVHLIELPYGDSLFTMSVMMPADPELPLDQFIQEQITSENLSNWRSNLNVSERDVTLMLPKFELEYEIEYKDLLSAMGMEIAFDPYEADLLGIADVRPQNLYIDDVAHKTFIRVDEEGTEAAAVTSVGVGITSLPPQMVVNRPFVFIIHERESGTNLFMGKVKNPANARASS